MEMEVKIENPGVPGLDTGDIHRGGERRRCLEICDKFMLLARRSGQPGGAGWVGSVRAMIKSGFRSSEVDDVLSRLPLPAEGSPRSNK